MNVLKRIYCRTSFIKHRDEVIDVSIFEYDEEGVMDVLREEAREEARKQALTEGRDGQL